MTKKKQQDQKKAYYSVIPAFVKYSRELSANSKLLYGEISGLCNEKGYCWANNAYFADLYGFSTRTVSKCISDLEKNNFISTEIEENKGNLRKIRVNIPIEENFHRSRRKVPEVEKKSSRGLEEKFQHNNKVNNKENNTISFSPPAKSLVESFFPKEADQNWDHKTKVSLVDSLRRINPSLKEHYKRNTTWKAVDSLFKTYGVENAMQLADLAVFAHGKPYAPSVTTPQELFSKASRLYDWYKKENNIKSSKQKISLETMDKIKRMFSAG